ncbi:Hypothetical protein PBC10988_24180 [Planctomycetales bacterium 10988]|nr:Hypothetical protein PBC10988_24180 [Planctomycetales bacterium 10988]
MNELLNTTWKRAHQWQWRTRRRLYQQRHPQTTTPVFVVGAQRSGTSMMLRVFDLSWHAQVAHTGDKRIYQNGLLRSHDILHSFLYQSKARLTVFKPMNQLQWSQDYLKLYPELKIIWMVRSMPDVVNSCVRKWNSMREVLLNILKDSGTAGWQAENLFPSQLDLLKQTVHEGMTLEEAYAVFWCVRNLFYFELGLNEHPQVKLVPYEEIVRRPIETTQAIFEFADCPFDPQVTREIFTSSVGKNPQPQLSSEIQQACDLLTERLQTQVNQQKRCRKFQPRSTVLA